MATSNQTSHSCHTSFCAGSKGSCLFAHPERAFPFHTTSSLRTAIYKDDAFYRHTAHGICLYRYHYPSFQQRWFKDSVLAEQCRTAGTDKLSHADHYIHVAVLSFWVKTCREAYLVTVVVTCCADFYCADHL